MAGPLQPSLDISTEPELEAAERYRWIRNARAAERRDCDRRQPERLRDFVPVEVRLLKLTASTPHQGLPDRMPLEIDKPPQPRTRRLALSVHGDRKAITRNAATGAGRREPEDSHYVLEGCETVGAADNSNVAPR
jgi:hypothetical protein